MRNSLEELSMNRVLRLFSRRAYAAYFSLGYNLGATSANATDKVFVSRTAEIDGVQAALHDWRARHSADSVAWLCGDFADVTPILPLLGEKFTVIAPDLPGIGDSSIPADGLDMKSAAIRIHALARSLGVEKARVVGHDIGLMVAYATRTVPRRSGEAGGDGCVPSREWAVGRRCTTTQRSGTFGSTGRRRKHWCKDANERISNISGTTFAADKTRSIPEADRKAYAKLTRDREG